MTSTLPDLLAGRLAGATRLDLRGAGLREMPREVFDLADTLQMLDLSGNDLEALPDDLHRLHRLRILFCSDNRFTALPASLGRCAQLDIVGFKANRIAHVPPESLPPALRWLILTDNTIEALPDALGERPRLQKLMLAGNRLRALPATLGACGSLELVRLAANRFERLEDALPDAVLALPRLAWIAFGGNPFDAAGESHALHDHVARQVDWSRLTLGDLLGEGASGLIHAATLRWAGSAPQEVAVKLFKGAMTSDGLPRSEMAACIAAGDHANIVGVLGQVAGHPMGAEGLVLHRVPPGYANLAGPPSFASCTRDVYDDALRFTTAQAREIARGLAAALEHLHARGIVHGDFYAHNVLVDAHDHALLGDFGAASFLPLGDAMRSDALRRADRRALGILVDELARRCDDPGALDDLRPAV